MSTYNKERIGEILILIETVMYSLFPIIIAYSTKILPPILFAGISIFVASITLFISLLFQKKLKSILNKQVIKYSLGIAIFIIILPSIFIFTGSSKTSGINTTILLQTEILFTFILFGIFGIEKITPKKILGAIIICMGTIAIMYNDHFSINEGDILIIFGTLFYPVGNYFAKKVIKIAAPTTILFIRSFVGGVILIGLSLLLETQTKTPGEIINYWPLILFSGIFIYHISKILWYEGIKRIDISKAIPISIGGYPAFSLIFAIFLLKEIPTIQQILGFFLILLGILILIKKEKAIQQTRIERSVHN